MWDDEDCHAGGHGAGRPGVRVLDGEAISGADSQGCRGREVWLGVRFAVGDVITGHDLEEGIGTGALGDDIRRPAGTPG